MQTSNGMQIVEYVVMLPCCGDTGGGIWSYGLV